MSERKEKKSERLEVRLPYSKKQAFVEACEQQSDTPSNAIRRFISSYIRRSDNDTLGHWAGSVKRKLLPVGAMTVAAIGVMSLAYWQLGGGPQTDAIEHEALYKSYDINGNDVIDIGEITSQDNEKQLFEVLDLNGDNAIDRDEFIAEGDVAWMYKKNDPQLDDENNSVVTETEGTIHYIQYDLSNKDNPYIAVWVNNVDNEQRSFRADKVLFKNRPAEN